MSPDFLLQVGERLKEERLSLGFKSQDKFADALEIPSRTYWEREKGKVAPDAEFLAKFCELGGDTMFVLTGQRTPLQIGESWSPHSPAEQAAAAIQALRLSLEDSELLIAMARRLAQK